MTSQQLHQQLSRSEPPYCLPNEGPNRPTRIQIHQTHKLFCGLTGIDFPITAAEERQWYYFLRRFNQEDLKLLLREKMKRIHQGKATRHILKPSYWLDYLDEVGQDLAVIRADARAPRYCPGKTAALQSTGREAIPPSAPAQPVGKIMKEHQKLASMLSDWKKDFFAEETMDQPDCPV